ncbi:MAG TPA: hypothetical protein VM053_03220 [Gemmatimonadaceae bacterium]|nr:hypothetical protein [Gemmatimonadaceae bacterium]
MTDDLKFPGAGRADSESLGQPLTGLVRDAYLPALPAESDAYWAGLEQRIMARVRAEGAEAGWWSVLAPWAQAGLVAATAIFALTSFINQRLSESESQYAYESVVQTPPPDADASESLFLASDKTAGRDATVEYVLSH